MHSDAKRDCDERTTEWHLEFLSSLMGVWPNSTIFVPETGDVPVPVGCALIFSGSKAHAGSAYSIGNRRLHIYFFSSRTWTSGLAPVDDVEKFQATRKRLLEEPGMDATTKISLESELMNSLEVFDFVDEQNDVFYNHQAMRA